MTEKNDPASNDRPTGAESTEATPLTDDQLRRLAAQTVAEQLALGTRMVTRCELWSQTDNIDPLATMHVAARLMSASARVTDSFVKVAQVERRNRSISERIEPINPKQRELNERKKGELLSAETRLKVYNRMNEHIEQSIRARLGEPGGFDSVARLLKEEEKEVARCQREVDDIDAG